MQDGCNKNVCLSCQDAGKSHAIAGEWLAAMLYECFARRVVTVSDANKTARQRQGQQLNCS